MTTATSLGRLASHSIHITTTPTPRNLSESKRVLSALQKFGEVVTFRNLKYDVTNSSRNANRATIAIYESADSARRALAASPLRIPLAPGLASRPLTQHLTTRTTKNLGRDPDPDPDPERNEQVEGEPGESGEDSEMICEIQPSRHNHHSAMQRNPFHGSFQVDRQNYLFEDVVRSGVPVKALAEGCMLRKEKVSGQVKRRIQRENERLGGRSLQRLFLEGMEMETEKKGNEG